MRVLILSLLIILIFLFFVWNDLLAERFPCKEWFSGCTEGGCAGDALWVENCHMTCYIKVGDKIYPLPQVQCRYRSPL